MPISNQREEIDIRLLRLIGLDDVFDLDYETYLTLLKEAMVKGRMTKKTIPTEEVMLLTEEYKRVKSKKDKGRFEVKKKKISAGSFAVGSVNGQLGGAKATKALPGSSIGVSPLSKTLEDNITAITSSIVSITETLKQQKKISGDSSAYDKRKAEQEKRGLVESKLEKRFEGLKKAAEKIIAPVKSLLDRIIQFFTTVILGRIVYKLVEWLGDEKNASKVKSIIRFVKDWWPTLLGSYILFGTSFGKLIRGLTGTVGRFIFQIGKVAIPQLLKVISANPVASLVVGGAAAAGVGAYAASQQNEQKREGVKPGQGTPGSTQLQREQVLQRGLGGMFSGGGLANGYVSGEKGVDKIPAMLSDGEFVMSRGAVSKYGVDTLEAMNAAGGGTNKPKVMGGTTFAAGGGMIGRSNTPFSKDPIDAISRFIKFKFGADPGKQSTWGFPTIPSSTSKPTFSSSGSTGSLMTDPIGAVARIANNMGIKTPNVPSSKSKPQGAKTKPGGSQKNMFQEIYEKLTGPGAATYRDAGSIYAKQMLGGFGGPISEMDLGGESQQELQKAIQRAKKRTGFEISKAEAKIKELRAQGAKDGNPALETQKSFLKKLKAGGIRVQYADYAEKGKMSESAKNAKNILGQFWAYGRDKKQGGGYRIEDKYDFDKMKDPMSVLFGGGKSVQQRLQALHQLNPLKGKGDVDMVLGGKRSAAESWGLSASKTLLGGMLGISGKPKEPKNIGSATMYKPNDPRRKVSGAYQSRFARPKNAGVRPVKPPAKPAVKVIKTSPQGGSRGSSSKPSTSRPPSFGASTKGSRTKADLIGVHR
jgi:hypothetical protein